MRLSKLFLLCMIVSQTAWAEKHDPLNVNGKGAQFDPIKESNTIPVIKEDTVQKDESESKHVLTFAAGTIAAQSLQLASNGLVTKYDLSNPTPVFSAGFGYFPDRFMGYWGLDSSFSYSYREQSNEIAPSVLHLFAFDTLLSYRFEASSRSWVKPFIGVGPGVIVAYQRGIDELNTSESHFVGVGELGLGLNLNRLFSLTTPLSWELRAQYKRWVEPDVTNANFNGQLITLGISTVL